MYICTVYKYYTYIRTYVCYIYICMYTYVYVCSFMIFVYVYLYIFTCILTVYVYVCILYICKYVHIFSRLMMYKDREELHRISAWPGVHGGSRQKALERLQCEYFSPNGTHVSVVMFCVLVGTVHFAYRCVVVHDRYIVHTVYTIIAV